MTVPDEAELRARWRKLVQELLPRAARNLDDWPVALDHCFALILLDDACGRPWREVVRPPAWRRMPAADLGTALELGEAALAGRVDLAELNRRSLRLRGKLDI